MLISYQKLNSQSFYLTLHFSQLLYSSIILTIAFGNHHFVNQLIVYQLIFYFINRLYSIETYFNKLSLCYNQLAIIVITQRATSQLFNRDDQVGRLVGVFKDERIIFCNDRDDQVGSFCSSHQSTI